MAFNSKRYSRELLAAFAAYAGFLIGSRWAIRAFDVEGVMLTVLAALPAAPALAVTAVALRHFATMDELQRRVQIESFAASALLVGLVTFSLGFVEEIAVPRISMIWVFPAILAGWGVIAPVLRRRYL